MKCPKCGTEYEGNFCPNGCNSPYYNTAQSQQSQRICPRCGGTNISYQRETTGNVGTRTNTVVVKNANKSKGCLYWAFIGWWWKPFYWIFIGWWWNLLFGGKSHGGLNFGAEKTINRTVAVCQNCGNSWKV